MGGWSLEGISALLDLVQVPVHVQSDELPWVERTTGVGAADLVGHDSGDVVRVGEVDIELIHTPGHTPGSQCFLVDGRLVAGDTLFLEGCGRTDFPGSDPLAMYESIHTRLARVPDEAILFPGHLYSADPSPRMGETREVELRLQAPLRRGVDGDVRVLTTTKDRGDEQRWTPRAASSSSARPWPGGGPSRRCAPRATRGRSRWWARSGTCPTTGRPSPSRSSPGRGRPRRRCWPTGVARASCAVHEVLGRRASASTSSGGARARRRRGVTATASSWPAERRRGRCPGPRGSPARRASSRCARSTTRWRCGPR